MHRGCPGSPVSPQSPQRAAGWSEAETERLLMAILEGGERVPPSGNTGPPILGQQSAELAQVPGNKKQAQHFRHFSLL